MNKLKEVTYLTIKDLKKQSIILPGKYSDIFEYHAKKLKLNINDEKIILKNLQEDERHVENIVKKTSENLTELQETTSHAQKAILNKDHESLRNINAKLSKMQDQIDFLQKELFSDPLTGAYNRKWLSDYYLKDDQFKNDGFIAFLDLNKFKFINDNYGHIVGDQVLKYLVKFLGKELDYPYVDILRYAGDEFIILFNKDKSTVLNIEGKMKEIQEKLSKLVLKSSKIKELKFSFSYGLIPFKKEDNFETVLETVDELMYKNKQENR
jgi:diguanylate cyclase (GGDEF)-like protein